MATPIGNLNDISARATEVLAEADIIACEDTRVAKKLFSLLGISHSKTFITYQDHNEENQAQRLIDLISGEGKSIALVSDAGSPLISDPGYKLVRKCREQGIYVTVIPGCCAFVCALPLSDFSQRRRSNICTTEKIPLQTAAPAAPVANESQMSMYPPILQ